jgi:hypothetical protein
MLNHQELPKWFFVLGWIIIVGILTAFFSEGILLKKIVLIFIASVSIAFLTWLLWRNTQ